MAKLVVSYCAHGWKGHYYVSAVFYFDKAFPPPQGHKYTLFMKLLKDVKFQIGDDAKTFTAEIDDDLAEILKILVEMKGSFPKKYVDLYPKKSYKEILCIIQGLKMARELKFLESSL